MNRNSKTVTDQDYYRHVPIMSVSESAFKEGFISAIKEMQPVLEEMARNIVSAQNDERGLVAGALPIQSQTTPKTPPTSSLPPTSRFEIIF